MKPRVERRARTRRLRLRSVAPRVAPLAPQGAGLTLRLIGFSVQSASTDDPALNFAQYLIPLIGILGALAVIYWPGRSRPEAPATSQAEAR